MAWLLTSERLGVLTISEHNITFADANVLKLSSLLNVNFVVNTHQVLCKLQCDLITEFHYRQNSRKPSEQFKLSREI